MAITAPIALGVGSALGGAIGGIYSANKSASASATNTKKQIEWERERAMNAHQWEVEDLKKAGINPVLTAGGAGAMTGSISPQMPDTSGYQSAGAAIASGVNIAMQQNLISAEIAKKKAEAIKTINETRLIEPQIMETIARKQLHEQTSANKYTENEIQKFEYQLRQKFGAKSIKLQQFRDLATGVAAGAVTINQLSQSVKQWLKLPMPQKNKNQEPKEPLSWENESWKYE